MKVFLFEQMLVFKKKKYTKKQWNGWGRKHHNLDRVLLKMAYDSDEYRQFENTRTIRSIK